MLQLLLLVGCFQSEVATNKVNPTSIAGFDSSNPVPVFSYASTTNAFSMGAPYILIPSVAYAGYGLSFSLAGTLPAGLSFDTHTGAISGIPTAAPVSPSLTITATNHFGSAYKSIILVTGAVFSYPLSSYDYSVGSPFTAITPTITYPAAAAIGFSVSPSLPAGLSLNPVTGTIDGTPTASSLVTNYNISATVNGLITTVSMSLHVAGLPSISYIGTNYYVRGEVFSLTPSEVYRGSGFAYSTPSGTLPVGLSFNTATGVISGTASAGGSGDMNFVVRTSNLYGLVDHTVAFVEVGPPVFGSATVADTFQRGSVFSLDLEADLTFPGAADVTYVSSPTLPNVNCSLSLNAATGVISGTVALTATANACAATYTITAMNTADPLSRTSVITLTLNETGPPQVGYPLTTTTYENALPFTITPTYYYLGTLATPTAYTLASGSLPAGLSLNASTGVISGTPTASVSASGAVHSVQVEVTNSIGTSVFSFDLEEIGLPRVTYSSTDLKYFRQDAIGSSSLTPVITFCKGGCSFSSVSFPGFAGPAPATEFSLNPLTGEITNHGIITTKISTEFSITIQDNSTPAPNIVETGFTIEEACNDTGTPYGTQEFGGGGGADVDPWLLCTPDHIKEISLNPSSLEQYYKLSDDINFTDADLPVYPIGVSAGGLPVACFSGGFDGNNYFISNFKVYDPGTSAIAPDPISRPSGLFSCLTDFDYIQNLTLINFSSFSLAQSGSLAGLVTMPNAPPNTNVISNVNSYRSYVRTKGSIAGGLIGSLDCQSGYPVSISNSIFHGTIEEINTDNVGGLLTTTDALTKNCVKAENNIVFLKKIDGGSSGSFLYAPLLPLAPPYVDVTDMATYGFTNTLVKNTLVADLDLAISPSPINAPSTTSYNRTSPELDLDVTWNNLNFLMGHGYSYTHSSSSIRWIVPSHLCERDTASVVQSPISPILFEPGGGGLVCTP